MNVKQSDNLDKIIQAHTVAVTKYTDYDFESKQPITITDLDTILINRPDLIAALESEISRRCTEARIDELEQLREAQARWKTRQHITERLAHLQQELGELGGKKDA